MQIPLYPPPNGPLGGAELLLGFADGAVRRITTAELLAYVAAELAPFMGAIMTTMLVSLPTELPAGSRQLWMNDGQLTLTD